MKKNFFYAPLLILISCTPQVRDSDVPTTQSGRGEVSGKTNPPPMQPRLVKVMSYNQYNMSLSKLTGVNSSLANTIFEQIRGSLPTDTNIEAMTSFNLVAKTRLADFYCGIYVNTNLNSENFDFLSISNIKNHLMTKFLDYDPSSPNPIFDSLSIELDHVLSNNDGDDGTLIPAANLTPIQLNKNLSILACVTILASSHITMIE